MFENFRKKFNTWFTGWKTIHNINEFIEARARLTFYYSITLIIILACSNFLLYNIIFSDLVDLSVSISENKSNLDIFQIITDNAHNILFNKFLMVEAFLVLLVIILGFFLSRKTLEPIKENLQKQNRFIADASHDLSTPITVMLSGLENSLHDKKLNFASAKKALENILNEMRDFSNLSNKLLDVSKYGISPQVDFEMIYITELVRYVIEKNKNLAQIKDINIETKIGTSAVVWGNKIELSRVFFNILDNAINYIPSGGTVSVHDEIISNNYVLTIKDNGSGIPKKILNNLFDVSLSEGVSKNASGIEFGLPLSKKIIENHKGTISIETKKDVGTTVVISLPVSV